MKYAYDKINKKLSLAGELKVSKRETIIIKELYKIIMEQVSAGGEKIWIWRN